jgi:cleavage stimulation factor subunit 2
MTPAFFIFHLVGNIPYELTEDQLTEVFKEVGPVVSFRLVFDRDSGRPRGYGFCEYHDSETAASAVRNLNNVEVGGRQLRVDYADGDPAASSTTAPQGERPSEQPQQRQPQPQQPQQQTPPQLPPQIVSPPSTTAQQQQQAAVIENISQAEQNSMNQTQLLEILSTMKLYIQTHYEQARILLTQNPQLSYSLFQIMVQLNLIDPSILPSLLVQNAPQQQNQPAPVQNTSQVVGGVNFGPPNVPPNVPQNVPPAPVVPQHQPQHQQHPSQQHPPQHPPQQHPQQHQQQHQQQQQQPPPMYGGMPPQQPQPMMQQPMQQQQIQPSPIQQPPMQQQPPPIQQSISQPLQQTIQQTMGMPAINSGMLSVMGNTGTPTSYVGNVNLNDLQMQEANQKSLLLQVLNLPQQQIDSLSPEQRNSLIALKQQLLLQTRQT